MADTDAQEAQEWLDSIDGYIAVLGIEQAGVLLGRVLERAREGGVEARSGLITDYVNTISQDHEPPFPGDPEMETRARHYVRWHAAAMVARANRREAGLGGHLATYASASSCSRSASTTSSTARRIQRWLSGLLPGRTRPPGVYARAFVEGRLRAEQLDGFRREVEFTGFRPIRTRGV